MRETLTASKSFTYAGRALQAGDSFEATRRDARVLRALKRVGPAGTYQTTELQTSVTKAPAKKAAAKKTKAVTK
ncbi:MAG: hypothetical protein EOO22_08945 [Comamonadaceae bacterium]|nr:MAG: hypothetical protein EOO22_08945 [Comamonadaceae bacterium]